jgi:hypothetical protein
MWEDPKIMEDLEKIRRKKFMYGDDYYFLCDKCKCIDNSASIGDDCEECDEGTITESI